MPGTTAWILADQLTTANPALDGADRVLVVQSSEHPSFARMQFDLNRLVA